ncbi:MAG TPA: type II toxin-antitoxin system RelE/ParE family toxin [Reyranella sp.]|nr:type II toxin-antitoxin system RelE/ParE family toxin [Reyranella sp.]
MIRKFRHRGLERLFVEGRARGVSARHVPRLRRILAALHHSKGPDGMALPGFRLHPLKGERRGQWAVSVSGNWRVVFYFEGEDAVDVDLVDYH